ncbi:Zn(II)2Cys6 transcription factor [Aspergillus brunneoviolaceus CBS 621.78]|uniref:Uncharacterized protein n=1 Tax=Aspergillus brunneoviolaceus CBS 621.78 TaxID=1450534 RepID=A0ACD1GI05_9EURO|nr:hypothetical protein BO95DRAFT_479866 [Aspergillus brunneoviolaceus CBS 621.78]RAH48876.1 hypothetical protein BO95DRAFT_479866 [Aspergillus brunneoviolaceus CBS 621.78]
MSGPRTRSHRGCSHCRRSKVKCDEKQPVCTRCFQKGLSCTRDTVTLKWESDYRARGVTFGRTGVWRKGASKKPSPEDIPSIPSIPSTADQTILTTPVIHHWSFIHADSHSLPQLLDHQDLVLMPARNVHEFSIQPALSISPLWNHLDQSFLLDYYIHQICPRTTPSPSATSPFAAIILPYCQTASPVVIKALMALAACHWSQQDPRYGVHALTLKSQVVSGFRRRIASEDRGSFLLSPDPEALVLIMLLCLYEIVDHCDRRWIVHLQGAKDIIRLRRQQQQRQADALLALPTVPSDPVSKFVELFFAFQDVMGRTACAKADLFGPSYWAEGDVTINDWMGCSPALVSILFAIMDLSRHRRHMGSSASEELTFRARASNLQRRLDDLVQNPAVGGEDETLRRVAELKRLACSVYIQCALHGARPCDPAVKVTVQEILAGVRALVAQGSASQAMMWPLFVAAVELDPLDDVVVENPSRSMEAENGGRRRLVLRLLMEMAKRSVSSVARMRAVIEGVWQRRDFHLHAVEDRKMGRFADLNDWEVFVVPGSDALSLV